MKVSLPSKFITILSFSESIAFGDVYIKSESIPLFKVILREVLTYPENIGGVFGASSIIKVNFYSTFDPEAVNATK